MFSFGFYNAIANRSVGAIISASDTSIFHLKGTTNVTNSTGNLVERWDDYRSNGNYVEQLTDGLQPTFDGDKITFDGVDDVMNTTTQEWWSNPECTIIIKGSFPASGASWKPLMATINNTRLKGVNIARYGSQDRFAVRIDSDTTSNSVTIPNSGLLDGLSHVFSFVIGSDNTVKIYRDAIEFPLQTSGMWTGNNFTCTEPLEIGFCGGDYEDIQIYNRALLQSEITKITEELT